MNSLKENKNLYEKQRGKKTKKPILSKFPFLKPIAKEISKLKLEKYGSPEKKILKYKAVYLL